MNNRFVFETRSRSGLSRSSRFAAAIALMLAGGGSEEHRAEVEEKFPTAALAVIDLTAESWAGIERRDGTLTRFVTPRALAAAR